ncbi:DcrB-related protein [Deinococcus alpinitundrae]|uniref:DcrB-related protein n=1 Tax=Deinococcus alpinitundrae TaxID=468913 RepID=UPI00137B87F6|nr:DcrB-related protein [Deinococcus alpinitundrae]
MTTQYRPAFRLLTLSSLLLSAAALAYTDATDGFSVTAPTGWKQSSYPGTSVVFLAPKTVSAFNPNINVLVQAVPAGVTLKDYDAVTLDQITKLITDGKLISKKAVTLDGLKATQLNYTGRQGQYKLYFTQTYALVGKKAYVLTGTTIQGQQAALQPVMDGFVGAFKAKR